MVRSAIRRLLLRANASVIGWTLCLLSIAAVFSPVLLRGELPLFRDAGNFYYPLWYYLAQQYRAGKLPLWDPYENLGAPLLANGTTAAFYPGVVLFLLPIPYPATYATFLLTHVLLAAWGAGRLSRELGCRSETRPLAGIIYALAGPTLFQIHNPVYLVGGAWLPWILAATWRIIDAEESTLGPVNRAQAETDVGMDGRTKDWRFLARSRLRAARLLAFASAMSVLGGDPQTAYHGALIAFGTWATVIARRLFAARRREREPSTSLRFALVSGGILAGAFGAAFCLAAVQVLPSWHYAEHSDRALLTKATVGRLWEAPPEENSTDRAWAALRNSRADTVYAFSVAPWRFVELLWPGFGGDSVPVHERYLRALIEEGRWWTPSLYLGVIPFLLALSAIRFRPTRAAGVEPDLNDEAGGFGAGDSGGANEFHAEIRERASAGNDAARVWLTWLALFAATASLGWYGPGSVGNALLAWTTGEDGATGPFYPPAGGPYWWLVRIVPGYAMFRYPGKWLPPLTIAVACLAAMGVELCWTAVRRIRWSASIAVCLSLAGVVSACLAKWSGLWDAMRVPGDAIFGPFRAEEAFRHCLISFSSTAALGLIVGLIAWKREIPSDASRQGRSLIRSVSTRIGCRRWTLLCMLLSAVDLALAAKPLVLPVRPPTLPSVLPQSPPRRVWRPFFWYPDAWQHRSSWGRLQELIDWERQTFFGRWGMVHGTANLQHYGTMMPVRYRAFLDALKTYMTKKGLTEPPGEILQWLGAERFEDWVKGVADDAKQGLTGMEQCPQSDRRCHCLYLIDVGRVERQPIPLANGGSIRKLWDDAEEYFFPGGVPRSPESPPVMEVSGPSSEHDRENEARTVEQHEPARHAALESPQCLDYSPGDVRIRVKTPESRLLVLTEQYMPGWRVEVSSGLDGTKRATTPVCVDRLFWGCVLPPGEWTVRWYYRQPGLQWGAWISAVSWLALAVVGVKLKRPSFIGFRWAGRRVRR